MAQKCLRARGGAICARLEHDDEITGLCLGHVHPVGKKVKRRAKRADYGRDLPMSSAYAVTDDYGIILSNNLAEIAGRG